MKHQSAFIDQDASCSVHILKAGHTSMVDPEQTAPTLQLKQGRHMHRTVHSRMTSHLMHQMDERLNQSASHLGYIVTD